jgi:hypothetical protein
MLCEKCKAKVLPGEDDIIKVLVSALEQIKSKLNIYTLNCECDCVAEDALADYNAWKTQGDGE